MKIVIQNKPRLPRKAIRFVKWKLYKLRRKFKRLIYVDLHIDTEGNQPQVYLGTVILGIKGKDILIKQKSSDPLSLFHSMYKTAHLKLAEVHKK